LVRPSRAATTIITAATDITTEATTEDITEDTEDTGMDTGTGVDTDITEPLDRLCNARAIKIKASKL
jgi:hypothetical protein